MRKTTTETDGENWWFWCPGCKTHHIFTTKRGPGEEGPIWTKTGSDEKPTFAPSLLYPSMKCHLFLRDGMVQYLNDCTHKFKGKTIPVEDPKF